jgi:uncharacterized protein
MEEQTQTKKPRGFATLSPKQHAEISRKGGKAAHEAGTAHRFTTETGKQAAQKARGPRVPLEDPSLDETE